MKITGKRLQEYRESQGISLQEVSLHLKINSRLLKALEEGDLSKLPARTFLRGFVQSYANFLHLDSEEILTVFYEEMGGSPNQSDLSEKELTPASEPFSINKQKWTNMVRLSIFLGVLTLIGLIYIAQKTIEKYQREAIIIPPSDIALQSPASQELVPTAKPGATEPQIAQEATALENPPVITDTAEVEPATIAQPPTENKVKTVDDKPIASPPSLAKADLDTNAKKYQPGRLYTWEWTPKFYIPYNINKSIPLHYLPAWKVETSGSAKAPDSDTDDSLELVQTEDAEQTPAPNITPAELSADNRKTNTPAIRPQEIIVEALDNITVEYALDNKKSEAVRLLPEQVHTFKANRRLVISLSDGGSANIIHNGLDLGVVGNLGQPIRLSFPRE